MIILAQIASVWVPFTSESKEAVAHYDDIIKEMKLALQECGRRWAPTSARRAPARRREEALLHREVHSAHRHRAGRKFSVSPSPRKKKVVDTLVDTLERSRSCRTPAGLMLPSDLPGEGHVETLVCKVADSFFAARSFRPS